MEEKKKSLSGDKSSPSDTLSEDLNIEDIVSEKLNKLDTSKKGTGQIHIPSFICSDYYIRHEKEQDVKSIETMDELNTLWHLVAEIKGKGLRVVATYDVEKELLTVKREGVWFLIPSVLDPIYKFINEVEKTYKDNRRVANEVVKKKGLKDETKSLQDVQK